LEFLKHIYGVFGFSFELRLSTRPEKYLGEIETWNKAEKQLEEALNEFGQKWTINPGDGAFYGPKVCFFSLKCRTEGIFYKIT
jgi:threonyl-tRNA synthetase